jgi:hypothetical protein
MTVGLTSAATGTADSYITFLPTGELDHWSQGTAHEIYWGCFPPGDGAACKGRNSSIDTETGELTVGDIAGTQTGWFSIVDPAFAHKVSIKELASLAADFNFNLPSTAGSTGQVLTSQGGGSTSMIWTNPGTTATNCAANGTAANPSVVACSAAAAGMFSCATAATTGTCQVNTTAVTANSEILITTDDADGGAGQLNVTCNTSLTTPAAKPLLHAKSAGASFTINLGTVAANPACFEYHIVN